MARNTDVGCHMSGGSGASDREVTIRSGGRVVVRTSKSGIRRKFR